MAQMAEKFLLSRLSRTGFLILIAIAAFSVIQRETLTAITAIVAAARVFSGNTFHPGRSRQPWPAIHRLLFVALLSLLATSLWTGPWSLTHWLYVAPLVGFALLPGQRRLPHSAPFLRCLPPIGLPACPNATRCLAHCC